MALDRNRLAPIPLRLMAGIGFIIHGYPKVFDAESRAGLAQMLDGMGIPLPEVAAWAAGIVEFGGGILLVLGALTVVASALLIIDMLFAMFLVHWGNGFLVTNDPPGVELNLLYIAMLAALILSGPGAFSVDDARTSDHRGDRR